MTSEAPKTVALVATDESSPGALDERTALRIERDELRARVKELDAANLLLEKEVVRRGVKLNCANVALARAQIAFDEISAQREEAVQDIAHDLKTPLTSIRGAAENLMDGIAGPVDENVKEYLGIIRDQSDRLVSTVNWLVQAIRIENQSQTLESARCDLSDVVADACNLLRPLAEQRGIDLTVEAPPQTANLDAPKVHSIVENLVGNALKFTPAGGRVLVSTKNEEGAVVLSVKDTGIGMNEETRSNLFRRYYRATQQEGSGLGLIIVKNLVRLHRGSLGIDSTPNEGTTITVTFPQECTERLT